MKRNKQVNIKLTEEEQNIISDKAKKYNFISISEYIRYVSVNAEVKTEVNKC